MVHSRSRTPPLTDAPRGSRTPSEEFFAGRALAMHSDVYEKQMIRKQVYIEEAQEAFLKRRAHELGVALAKS